MSSITDQDRGQALAFFALSLTAVLMAAALAFDGGMMYLERRDQQNAADAAAMAGARYLVNNSSAARTDAFNAADAIATANGFTSGASETVHINIPPTSGQFQGLPGYIEVWIEADRPSIFAGIMGVAGWDVSARAVALNGDGATGGFSILSLHPDDCPAVTVEGNGSMLAYGDIQVNSTCTSTNGAMRAQGQGEITVQSIGGACNVVGDIVEGGQGTITCDQPADVLQMADPLGTLAPPTMAQAGGIAPPPVNVNDPSAIEDTCPGSGHPSKEPTLTDPNTCTLNEAGETWRLFPGVYPGGINLKAGTFYLDPGIYWIAGGGVTVSGNGASVISTTTAGTTPCTSPEQVCGVMFYNSHLPNAGNAGKAGDFGLGGASATLDIDPIDHEDFGGIVFWQERPPNGNPYPGTQDHPGTLPLSDQPMIEINGSSSQIDFRGTIYSPGGHVRVNGSSPPQNGPDSQLIMDQIIALTYHVNGATDSEIRALAQEEYVFKLKAAGLVE